MFYGFVKLIIGFCFKIYFRIEIYGSHHIPPTGGMILASNHVSYLDPLFMGCGINRPISFMAKQELFDIPAIGWLIRKLYVFPVKRNGADRQAIRQALEVLKHGNVLGIFPEGTRGDGVRLLKAQPGTVLLAARSGTPIVPMAIVGAEKALPLGKLLPRPSKVKVFIGEPIYLPKFPRKSYRDALGKYSRDLMDKIDELRSYEIAA